MDYTTNTYTIVNHFFILPTIDISNGCRLAILVEWKGKYKARNEFSLDGKTFVSLEEGQYLNNSIHELFLPTGYNFFRIVVWKSLKKEIELKTKPSFTKKLKVLC